VETRLKSESFEPLIDFLRQGLATFP